MIKAFIDPDLILEFLMDKQPQSRESAKIFTLAERNEVKLLVSAQAFSNLYLILKQYASHEKVVEKLQLLTQLVEVGTLDQKAVLSALNSNFNNLIDGIQNYCVESNNVKVLITRRHKDYKNSGLSIMSPALFLEMV
ncbi:PIN domain-containing protein [Marinoscillum pacificum]|uniref:PIN domain-containing protein n=1 Tax=Marinoscillum pacificum TaxID=392723 RepID=UPI0021586CFF|nr:PIN domain-containing protein [Marinoscillum pacificum]